MTLILQKHLPFAPWMDPRTARLPGVLPLTDDSWLSIDDAYAAQMAERDRLIAETPTLVHGMLESARPAVEELYDRVLAKLAQTKGYAVGAGEVRRPDGVAVALDKSMPLLTLGRLVQEDLCLMQAVGDESVLSAAILCFPASWTLAEKLGRSMIGIHLPVAHYDDSIARRVQRLFDAIRPERPLWRANYLVYDDPVLFQPRTEVGRRRKPLTRDYLRSEKQCLLRLPKTGAVLFAIHTYLLRVEDLTPEDRAGLDASGK